MTIMNKKPETATTKYDIISISHYFYPRVGGLENAAYGLLKYLSSKGLRTLSLHGGQTSQKYEISGIDCDQTKVISLFGGTYPVFTFRFFAKLIKNIKSNPDAVVLVYDRHLTSSVLSALACVLLRKKYIVVSQTTVSNYFKHKVLNYVGAILDKTVFKLVLKCAEQVICVSNANKAYLQEHLGIDSDKMHVIYNSFNEEIQKKFVITKKEKIAVFATKWSPVKDPDTTAKAFRSIAIKNPDWTFMFIGQGDSIAQRFRKIPGNMKIIKRFYDQTELFKLLSRSSVYVNSSINEGLSLAIVEATALGNLPVVSDAPANKEISMHLEAEDYVFARGSQRDLEKKLSMAIANYEAGGVRSNRLGELTKRNFSSTKTFATYYEFLQEYLADKLELKHTKPSYNFHGELH